MKRLLQLLWVLVAVSRCTGYEYFEWVCYYDDGKKCNAESCCPGLDCNNCDIEGCCKKKDTDSDPKLYGIIFGSIFGFITLFTVLFTACILIAKRRRKTRSQASNNTVSTSNVGMNFTQLSIPRTVLADYYREHYGYDQSSDMATSHTISKAVKTSEQ